MKLLKIEDKTKEVMLRYQLLVVYPFLPSRGPKQRGMDVREEGRGHSRENDLESEKERRRERRKETFSATKREERRFNCV